VHAESENKTRCFREIDAVVVFFTDWMFASELCRSAAEEDEMDAEDLQNELAPIQVQLGFVKQQLGKPEEAVEIYNSVLKTKYFTHFFFFLLLLLLRHLLTCMCSFLKIR